MGPLGATVGASWLSAESIILWLRELAVTDVVRTSLILDAGKDWVLGTRMCFWFLAKKYFFLGLAIAAIGGYH
jgi:hypothetical protein